MKKVSFKGLLLVSSILIFTSCEIGLGGAVDTEPPSVKIVAPEADARVRETFTMSGNWNDDMSIGSIDVSFRDVNDPSKIYKDFKAEIKRDSDQKGSWTCSVNPTAAKIPDGTYVATVNAHDNSDHHSSATTTFSIDNTAPLVVLDSPNTTDINNPNAFGQVFTVTGKAADDSDIDSIDFVFYDENKVEKYRKNITGIGTQIEVTVAEWGKDVYNEIYGTDKEAGTKKYYVGVIAFDGARKVPAVEGDKGNSTQGDFYLWDTLEESLGEIKTTVGYKVKNARSAASDDVKAKWLDALDKCKIQKASFSLNPVNNPNFEVVRYEACDKDKIDFSNKEFTNKYTLVNKNTLSINIFRGRDNKALKEDTIGVYLREIDSKGNLKENGKSIALLKPYKDRKGNVIKDSSGAELISQEEHKAAIKKVDSSYSTTFSVNNETFTDLAFNTNYLVDVVAYDINDVEIRNENNKVYVFQFVTSASAPVITIKSPANGKNIPNTKDLEGKVYKVEGFAKTLEDISSIIVYDDNNGAGAEVLASSLASSKKPVTLSELSKEKGGYDFSFNIDTSDRPEGLEDLPKIVVEVTSGSGLVSTQEIKIDPDFPKIDSNYSVTPEVIDENNVRKVNGTVRIKQPLSDNQIISKAQYSLDDGKTWSEAVATNMLSFDVHTTEYTKDLKNPVATKNILLKVEDSAGNISKGQIVLNIDQETDRPVIKLTNADSSITDASTIDNETNLFGTLTNNKLIGTITDDDGIKTITITVKDKDGKNKSKAPINAGGKTSYNLNYELPSVEGLYDIQITVEDFSNEAEEFKTGCNKKELAAFKVAVDNGAPNITVSNEKGEYQAANSNFILEGTCNDKDARIGIYTDSECNTQLANDSVNLTVDKEDNWSYKISTGSDGATIYIKAVDAYKQRTIVDYTYKIDAVAPKFEVTQVGENDKPIFKVDEKYTTYASANSLYTVRGTVKDTGPSGLADNLYYLVSATEPAKDSGGKYYLITDSWKKAIISKNADKTKDSTWVANIDLGEKSGENRLFEEGKTYNLYLAVKDEANNTSLISENGRSNIIQFSIDSTNPVFENLALEDIDGKSYITISAKDDESGIDKVSLIYDSVKQNAIPTTKTHNDDSTIEEGYTKYLFEVNLENIASSGSSIKYQVKIEDKAGNSVSTSEGEINNSAPSITFNQPGTSNEVFDNFYRKGEYYYSNKEIKIGYKVEASGNGISGFKYKENSESEITIPVTAGVKELNGTSAENCIKIAKPDLSKQVDNLFTATNKYNRSSSTTLKYIFDLDLPAINLAESNAVMANNKAVSPKSDIYYYDANKNMIIAGTAADNENATTVLNSGLYSVEYRIAKGHVTEWPTDSRKQLRGWESTSGSSNWSIKLDSDIIKDEGPYTVFVRAKDNVGNEKELTPIKIAADIAKPEIKVTSSLNEFNKSETVIKGTIKETYLDSYKVTVSKDGKEIAGKSLDSTLKTFGAAGYEESQNWQITIPAADNSNDGKYEIVVEVIDLAGNKTSESYTTNIDTTKPVYTINAPLTEDTGKDVTKYFTDVNSPVEISGTVTEKNISGVYYKLADEKLSFTAADAAGWTETSVVEKDGVKNWSSKFYWTDFTKDKEYFLNVGVLDKAGNVSDEKTYSVKFYPDSAKPLVTMNNSDSIITKDTVRISGTVTEANLKSFIITVSQNGTEVTDLEKKIPVTGKNSEASWDVTLPREKGDGTYKVTIVATDIAGQTNDALSTSVLLDTVAPSYTKDSLKLKGTQYDSSAWFNSTSMTVAGTYYESGSGFDQGYFFVNPEEADVPNATNIDELITATAKKYTDTFGITGDFSFTTSGFEAKAGNKLYLVVKDKAGNYSKVQELTVNVDEAACVFGRKFYQVGNSTDIKELTETTNILTNKQNAITIYGNISDAASGVAEINGIKFGTTAASGCTVTYSNTEIADESHIPTDWAAYDSANKNKIKSWKMEIAKDSNAVSGALKLNTNDVAGNLSTETVCTLTVDTVAPTATINIPNDADTDAAGVQVNKTISLSGTAADNQGLSACAIKAILYSSSAASDVKPVSVWDDLKEKDTDIAFNGTTNWSCNFDTTKLEDGTYYFALKVEDTAGNTGYSEPVELKIDQNSDRPVIKIPSLSAATATIQETVIRGTVSDDDGIAANGFEYSLDGGKNWASVAVSGGSWTIDLAAAGVHSLSFCVKDTAETTFTTAGADKPYIKLGTAEKSDNADALSISVDLTAPVVTSLAFSKTTSDAATPGATSWTSTSGSITYSPTDKYMWITVTSIEDLAMHESALDDVSVTVGATAITLTDKIVTRTAGTKGDSGTPYTFTIGPVDATSIKDGTHTVTVTVKDNSGRATASTFNISKDSSGPDVVLSYPSANDVVTGKVTLMGSVTDTTGIRSVDYLIPNAEEKEKTDAQLLTLDGWQPTGTSGTMFASLKIPFESSSLTAATSGEGAAAKKSLIYYAKECASKDANGKLTLPVYFRTIDTIGNSKIIKRSVVVNPDGGIPTVELTSHSNLGKSAGTVNLMGTASDDESVASVKITKLEYTTEETVTDTTKAWTAVSDTSITGLVVADKGSSENNGKILCAGTNSWKASIDTSKLIAEDKKDITAIRVTVEAFDENGTSSSQIHLDGETSNICKNVIIVDRGNPTVTSKSIVGFATKPTKVTDVPTLVKEYESGMYISKNNSKNMYLKLVVEDDTSVKGIALSCQSGSGYVSAVSETGKIASGLDTKKYTVLLPITTADEGKVYATIELDDGQHTDVKENYVFNIDNTKPELPLNSDDSVRIKNDSGEIINMDTLIENSDGSFTFGDTVSESGAGLQYLGIWFGNGGNIYNPLIEKETDGTINKKVVSDSIYENSDGFACEKVTGDISLASDGKTSALAVKTDKFIRRGGLIKYDGTYRKITAVTANSVTFTPAAAAKTNAEVEIIYADIVDRQGLEVSDTYSATASDDVASDGDGLVEMLKVKGRTYTWQATVDSKNLPDGVMNVHVVAIDNAGNVSSSAVKTMVANNRPRVARVYLATDLNGNGKFDFDNSELAAPVVSLDEEKATPNGTEFGELVYYSTLSSDGKIKGESVLSPNACKFVASGKTLVLSEIVGGNGTLKYAYSVGDDDAAASTVGKTSASGDDLKELKLAAKDLDIVDSGSTDSTTKIAAFLGNKTEIDGDTLILADSKTASDKKVSGNYHGLVLSNEDLKKYESWVGDTKAYKYFAFTYWDATPGTTQGTDSLFAVLKIPMIVNVVDDVAPVATIEPFHWTSWDDSSTVVTNGSPEGHIDLEADIGQVNPTVSGKIVINGTAEDETRLLALYINEPSAEKTIKVAEYNNGSWTKVNTGWPENWIDFHAEDIGRITQSGHKVKWQFTVDMTPYGVMSEKTFRIVAEDDSQKKNNAGEVEKNKSDISSAKAKVQTAKFDISSKKHSTELTPTYIMDCVPYIKDVGIVENGVEVSGNRSRLGAYSVRAGQTVRIHGMNFAKDALYAVNFYKTKAGELKQGTTKVDSVTTGRSGTIKNEGYIDVKAPEYSCWVEVTVGTSTALGSIKTQNNQNEIRGYTVTKGYVATSDSKGEDEASNNGTNFWTDDVYLNVWNNTEIAHSTNPWDGSIKQIIAKDLKDGKYYKNKSGNGFNEVTGVTDTWSATWSSPDMIMYTSLGTGDCGTGNFYRTMWNTSEAQFTFPVRTMDWAIIGGKNWYVVRDDYVGNSSANCWGPGLFLGYEGFSFPKNKWNSSSQPSDSEAYNIIERQGKDQPARTRAPSTGYDSLQEQFQNPHITGWYNANPHTDGDGISRPGDTYIYISYYDSFAKCLKYAAYKEDWTNGSVGEAEKWGSENVKKNLTKLARAADNMTKETVVVAGVDRLFAAEASDYTAANGADCGLYNDIMVDPTDHYPVLIYYNKTAGTLEVAHGKSNAPVTANYKEKAGAFDDTTENATGWTKTKNITPVTGHDFGRYVSAEIDSKGNIHAAAQDFTTGALYYIFLKKNGTSYDVIYKPIDSECSSAVWTDIRLDADLSTNTNWYDYKPVVSYVDQAKKLPKVAYIRNVKTRGDSIMELFDAIPDANKYESTDMKTSVLSSIYETTTSSVKAKAGISFNSDVLALDFLRDEQ